MATNMEWLNNGIAVSYGSGSVDPEPEQMPGDWMPTIRHRRPHVAASQRKGKGLRVRVATPAEHALRVSLFGRDPNRAVWVGGA